MSPARRKALGIFDAVLIALAIGLVLLVVVRPPRSVEAAQIAETP